MSAFLAHSMDPLCGVCPLIPCPCPDSLASLILGDMVEEAGLSTMQVELEHLEWVASHSMCTLRQCLLVSWR